MANSSDLTHSNDVQHDSVTQQSQKKNIAVRNLIAYIAEIQGKKYTREFQVNTLNEIRYLVDPNNHWTYFIDRKVLDYWHHLDDIAKLSIYVVAMNNRGLSCDTS